MKWGKGKRMVNEEMKNVIYNSCKQRYPARCGGVYNKSFTIFHF